MPVTCPKCNKTFPQKFGTHAWRCGITVQDIFWARVDKSAPGGCWVWTASLRQKGYGQFMWKGTMHRAHRLSYEWTKGNIPDGMHVLHSCHNRRCVNPDHLKLGTHQENMAEMWAAGRQATKLNADRVREIRARFDGVTGRKAIGELYRELSAKYGVTWRQILTVRKGKQWKNIA